MNIAFFIRIFRQFFCIALRLAVIRGMLITHRPGFEARLRYRRDVPIKFLLARGRRLNIKKLWRAGWARERPT